VSASDFAGQRFDLRVTELASGWRMDVDAGEDRTAEFVTGDLDVAAAMLAVFVRAVCQPQPLPEDTLERLYRQASAPDGPRDQGGDRGV
jgi:hypothetical protein